LIRRYAAEREISLGRAVGDLVHRGVQSLPEFEMKNGWVVFHTANREPLTEEMVNRFKQSDYNEEYRNAISPRR
jgi:predicted DNA-binding protein YlxM (UPF0122 family)